MKNRVIIFISLFLLCFTWGTPIHASSTTAYEDYLYQSDVYRTKQIEFRVARDEYLKYKTLISESNSLEKTKIMLSQRAVLLKSYLFLLNEKLNEDGGLRTSEKQLYQTLIKNETTFLDDHAELISEIGTIDDAINVGREFESHYKIMQASIRQTIVALSMGTMNIYALQFQNLYNKAQETAKKNRQAYIPQKQSIMDRWLIQISNKFSLYQQKMDGVAQSSAGFKTASLEQMDTMLVNAQKDMQDAQQYMVEGTAFMQELLNAMKYKN